jgi:hypothetical protein
MPSRFTRHRGAKTRSDQHSWQSDDAVGQGSAPCGILNHDQLSWMGCVANHRVATDGLRLVTVAAGPRTRLAAENLFLREQLALYVERQVKPRRADGATRITLVILSRWIDWRGILAVVQPDTLRRWIQVGCCITNDDAVADVDKRLFWVGTSLEAITAFPADARRVAGHQLRPSRRVRSLISGNECRTSALGWLQSSSRLATPIASSM